MPKALEVPLVSVLIPAYNVEAFIARAIEGVLGQSYPNLEVVVVDDGSTDATTQMVVALAKEDKRIHIHRQENRGIAATRDVLLALAKGKYLHFFDPDDRLSPDYYKECVKVAEKTGADLCATGFETTKWQAGIHYDKPRVVEGLREKVEAIGGLPLRSMVWRYLFRADFVKRAGLSFGEGRGWEDLRFTPVALAKSGKLAIVPRVLYHYVDTPDSLSANKKKFSADYKEARRVLKALDKEYGLDGLLLRNFVREEIKSRRPGLFARLLAAWRRRK